jgi:hypothetical protein
MEELRPIGAQRIERGMRQRRLIHRRGLVEKRESFPDSLAGKTRIGRDSQGNQVTTKEARAFKMQILEDGLVKMSTGLQKSNAGSRTLGGTGTRTSLTDIFHATRMAIHIKESEAADIAEREAKLRKIEKLNADLAAAGKGLSNELILLAIRELRPQILEMLNKKDAERLSYRPENEPLLASINEEMFQFESRLKIDAGIQLARAEETLQKAFWEKNASAKSRSVFNACAQMQAFLNRFGKWRDEEVEGILQFNLHRECALRAERDLRLEGLLEKWASDLRTQNPWATINLWKKDLANAERLEKCAAELSKKGWKESLEALGKELKAKGYDGKWGKYSVVEKLREAYSVLKKAQEKDGAWEEGKGGARALIEGAARVLKSDKPAYVLAQLEESGPEEYLLGDGKKSIYSYISKGVELLGKRVPEGAARCFESAHKKMQELNRAL